jgi:hypothetical protein
MKHLLYYLFIGICALSLAGAIFVYARWSAERELNRYDAYDRLANP